MALTVHIKPKTFHNVNHYRYAGVIEALDQSLKWTDFRIGADDPLWKVKVARHEDATNNYDCASYWVELADRLTIDISWWQYSWGQWGSWGEYASFCPITLVTLTHSTRAESDAIAKFNSRLREFTTPIEGGAFLAELRDSIEMIHHASTKIIHIVKNHRAFCADAIATARSPKKLRKVMSQSWLQAQFGIKPLIQDIGGIMTALEQRSQLSIIMGSGKDVVRQETLTGQTFWGCQWTAYQERRVHQVSTRCLIKGAVNMALSTPANSNAAYLQRFGLEASRFVPTVWELVPYSFLVDYFTNVGDWINGVFSDTSMLAWCFKVTKSHGFYLREFHLDPYGGQYSSWPSGANYKTGSATPYGATKTAGKIFNRVKGPSLIPQLQFTYPPFDSTRWVNMLALLNRFEKDDARR